MPSPSSVTWTSTRGRGPAPTSKRPPNTVSSDRRVVRVSRPPPGMASIPFWTRFWNTWTRRSASAQSGGRLGS